MQNDLPPTPEKPKLKRKEYEEDWHKLQVELCVLQEWVRHKGLRIIVGRIGRHLFRAIAEQGLLGKEIQVVAVKQVGMTTSGVTATAPSIS